MKAFTTRVGLTAPVAIAALVASAGLAVARPATSMQFGRADAVKVRLPIAAPAPATQAAIVGVYDSFIIYEVPASTAAEWTAAGADVLVGENNIRLNVGDIDTSTPQVKALVAPRGNFEGKALHLVQFAGAIQPAWRDVLDKTGVQIVNYIPNNAYLVYGDADSLARVQNLGVPEMQWNGAYRAQYAIDPEVSALMNDPATRDVPALFMVQMVKDEAANAATMALITKLQNGPMLENRDALIYHNVTVAVNAADVAQIAARPDVISIQNYGFPALLDERQDQIVAGNLTGGAPSGPGYFAWITGKGFTQAQFTASNFAIDLTDSGIDNGTTSPNHFGLYVSGTRPGTSRIIYNRVVGTPHTGSTLQGCDGHGTLNSHIIGGFNTLTAAAHVDSSGYHYGLGVCPWVKVGSSTIFDPSSFTNPNFTELQSRAYNDGARISSNSWGNTTGNTYNAFSQEYDALVRDAQPTGAVFPAAGNQEMVIIFANGNSGTISTATHAPATAKNVISCGASENVQAIGGSDGSGIPDSGADNSNDMATFSSRGPTSDSRKKPDLCAPGTHVSGGAPQDPASVATGIGDGLACYNGSGVSGGVAGADYFPAGGQQFWTASSGTSHSTPCISGGAALIRQHFINNGRTAPSPAMTKAILMNSTRYMTGLAVNDTLWSTAQGMGHMNLNEAFNRVNGTPTIIRDEVAADMFTASGQTRTFNGTIASSTQPVRVTLAWTDAPGATSGAASNNNLNLTVTIGANTYRGNVFTGANSVTGGTADAINNVESVFIPAGVTGAVTVTVTAANIVSDGVPNVGTALDQDFALVGFNIGQGPTNDLCAGAAPLALGATVSGSNVGAATEGSTNCGSGVASDVWYTLPVTCAGLVRVDTCGSGFDTVVSVHSACPGTTANQLACNDDYFNPGGAGGCPNIRDSAVNFTAAANTTYSIRVGGYNGATGSFQLHTQYANGSDTCAGAPVITDGSYSVTNCGANTDGPTEAGCSFCCSELQVNGDLWFRYNPTSSGTVRVTTCGSVASFDTKLAVYAGACPTVANTAIACNDDAACGSNLSDLSFAVVGGQSYLIRFGGYSTSRGTATMVVSSTPACGGPDFNGDGDIGTDQDIEAFFRCLAGFCCATCGSPDFNGDGDIGTDQDIEAFFRVLAGGNC